MAMTVPPKIPERLSESEAEALFREAREVERRRRRRKVAGMGAVAGVALAVGIGFGVGGGSGGEQFAGHGGDGPGLAGSNQPQQIVTETVAAASSVCSLASQPATPGDPPPGQCVTSLPNGHRYQCPISTLNGFGGDAMQAARSRACHGVAAPRTPASWRPILRRMDRAKACLQSAGLTAVGSATPPSAQRAYPDTPIAAIMITANPSPNTTAKLVATPKSSRPSIVSFYLTPGLARQAYNRTMPNVTRQGQRIATSGRVLYTWNDQHASQATTEQRCVKTA